MKQICVFVLFVGLHVGAWALELRAGPVSSGWNTFAVEAIVEGPTSWFGEELRPEVGLEVGLAGASTQALAPFGLLWESYGERGWSWGFSAHGLLGGSSLSSSPSLVWGGEGELRGEWSWEPGVSLGLSVGGRYTLLGVKVAQGVFEVPVHLTLEFALGGEETLEPSEGEEKEDSR